MSLNSIESIKYGNKLITYEVHFTKRKKTIGISVTPEKEILVRAPKKTPKTEINKLVRKKAPWILKKLDYFGDFDVKQKDKKFVSGETHRYLGKQYKLKVVSTEGPSDVKLKKGQIIIENPRIENQFSTKTILGLWYKERASTYIRDKSEEIYDSFKSYRIEKPKVSFKTMKKKWGMCSNDGEITLNYNLIKTPSKCIEYVLIHEYCHLIEHNHSKKFYKLLESHMPEWKKWKKRLDEAVSYI